MNVYFSGLGGVGIGPLAEIAKDAGHSVAGSDLEENLVTKQLRIKGIPLSIGQDGSFLQESHLATPFDWFVHTSALPSDHPELLLAQRLGIKTAKRDEFLAFFLSEHKLKLLAISGTHGKTTTTSMAVWAFQQLGVPVSYSVGTTLSFGPSGVYTPKSEYFIYECDEYDRNFLHFHPDLSLLTSIDYDHPDTYPSEEEYRAAFRQYIAQSKHTIAWKADLTYLKEVPLDTTWALDNSETLVIPLAGAHNRRNATLVYKALEYLSIGDATTRVKALESFPGSDRRFEKLQENLYTDYGHHPKEIAATLQLAKEISPRVVLVYQPHQNIRQHEIKPSYTNAIFEDADEVYWAPTYLTREKPGQPVLSPAELTQNITTTPVHHTELTDALWTTIQEHRANGSLVRLMGAGTIDSWARGHLDA